MKKPSPLIFIFATVFIDMVGFGIVIPILPLYAARFGAGATTVGMLIAIYSLMQFLSAPILGRLSDRYGRRLLLALSLFGTAIGYFLTGWGASIFVIFLGRLIDGITGGNISIAQAYIADVTKKEERAKAMGMIGAAFGLGFIIGPVIGGMMGRISIGAPFFLASAISLLNTIGVLLFLPEPVHHEEPKEKGLFLFSPASLREALKPPQIGAFVGLFFLINLGFSMIHGITPLFTQRRFGWDAGHNGYFFAFLGVIMVVVQAGLIGRLVKKFGELRVAIVGFLLLALGMATLGSSIHGSMFFFGGLFVALGSGLANPTLQALVSKHSSADEQGGVLGIAQGFGALARTAGPLYGGWVFDFVAPSFTYFSGSLILLCMTIVSTLSFRWLNRRR